MYLDVFENPICCLSASASFIVYIKEKHVFIDLIVIFIKWQ